MILHMTTLEGKGDSYARSIRISIEKTVYGIQGSQNCGINSCNCKSDYQLCNSAFFNCTIDFILGLGGYAVLKLPGI